MRTLVPQNNLAQDQDFCPSNYSHGHCMCQKEESHLALTTQDQAAGQQHNATQSTIFSHLQHCHTNQDAITHNTKSKTRFIEDVIPPPPNQASILGVSPHVIIMYAQLGVDTQHQQDINRGKSFESQVAPTQSSSPIVPKVLNKAFGTLNIVHHMKWTNVSAPMCNVVTIMPSQWCYFSRSQRLQEWKISQPEEGMLQVQFNQVEKENKLRKVYLLPFMSL